MSGRRLVNGVEGEGLATDDRGLQYGDGLFETMLARDGKVRNFDLHMQRLELGCRALGMPMPVSEVIEAECTKALRGLGTAVVKLVLTRGSGPRSYAPPLEPNMTRIISATSTQSQEQEWGKPVTAVICETRLGINPSLAGYKHINRLEQVLGAAELRVQGVDEGLMFATDGRLIAATASNVFLVKEGRVLTPDIRDCGIAGVMRQLVLRAAEDLSVPVAVGDFTLADVQTADEVFVTNAVRGIRCVSEIKDMAQYSIGPVALQLRDHIVATAE